MTARLPPPELEALVLTRARAGLNPSASERRTTLAKLALGLAAEPLAPNVDEAVVGAKAASQFSLKSMALGITASAVISFGAGYGLRSGQLNAQGPTAAPPASSATLSLSEVVQPVPTVSTHGFTVPVPAVSAPLMAGERDSGKPERKPVRGSSSKPEAAPSAVVAPFDELAYIRRAQLALKRGDGAHALGLMRELEERNPGKTLAAERSVTRVLALCELGRTDEAQALATKLLGSDPNAAVYTQRLATSCAHSDLNQKINNKQ